MTEDETFGFGEKKTNYLPMAVAAIVILVIAVSAYYYLSTKAPTLETSVITYPTTTYVPPPYGANMSAQWNNISANSHYALNVSYLKNSTINYTQVQAIQYRSPMFYGTGALTAYDSMVGNPEFEFLANNGMPVNSLAAKHPNSILEIWAYTEPFNTPENATGMYENMSSQHMLLNQSVPSQITPGIGDRSMLLTYHSITGQLSSLDLYMIFFVQNRTFVQMGAWMPKNSTPEQMIGIARAY
ncbi:MAG: hypothetical protein KGH50_03005, partial [Candidatus Micrarchaeota archaeon]|nr:hypothetical protein [Candidatus Micrarchaeota archaeon]